ncbi:MAG: phosphotransferase family protein [Acidobacteriota bacterium]
MPIEPVDIEQPESLIAYLRRTSRIGFDEKPKIQNLAGGVSNRTVLVERPTGEAWVLKQALVKLRVPEDWFSSPERIHREALALQWLPQLAPAETITPLIFEDSEHHLLAMKAIPQPHHNWKTLLLTGQLKRNHVKQFAQLLGTIHCRALAHRREIASVFDDRSFFESLRLEPYYSYSAMQVPTAANFLGALVKETRARRITLVHGDYSPKNIVVYENKFILLDHEVIHFGDPSFDLGFSLTHLLSKAHHVASHRDAFSEVANYYWQTYLQTIGQVSWGPPDLEQDAVRHTLGCLLARVAGRSPLEYFNDTERTRQREVVLELIRNTPTTIPNLIHEFITRL